MILDILNKYHMQQVSATAINMMCVEDIAQMQEILIKKHGEIEEDCPKCFKAGGKIYPKPRIERNREGTLVFAGDRFYLLNARNQRSYGLVKNLKLVNGKLNYIVDATKDYRIEYELL